MANPARQKGTSWENEVLAHLREIYGPGVKRTDDAAVSFRSIEADFINIPVMIEAKARETLSVKEWVRGLVRKARAKHNPVGDTVLVPWAIWWKGDRRSFPHDLAILPGWYFRYLLKRAEAARLIGVDHG